MAAGQGIRRGRGAAQGRERLPGGGDGPPGAAARGHLPGDQGPHPGNGPLRAQPQGRLVVLHPLGGGPGIRHPVPRPGRGHRGPRRRLDAPRRRGRRRNSGRGNPAGRQRRGGGQAVLRRRRCRRHHRREPLRLRRGQRRGRAVHAAHQGPADRGTPSRRDRERLLRHLLLPRRHPDLLHRGGRLLAALPGEVPRARHARQPRTRSSTRRTTSPCGWASSSPPTGATWC